MRGHVLQAAGYFAVLTALLWSSAQLLGDRLPPEAGLFGRPQMAALYWAVSTFFWLLISNSDPGALNVAARGSNPEPSRADDDPAKPRTMHVYAYDRVMHRPTSCDICKIQKPARAKHCHVCNRCVARFDHHCGWINTCVGLRNMRFFLLFLIWHILIMLHGFILGLVVLRRQVVDEIMHRMEEMAISTEAFEFFNRGKLWPTTGVPLFMEMRVAYHTEFRVFTLVSVLFLMACTVLGLLIYHMYLVLVNQTTYERLRYGMHRKRNENVYDRGFKHNIQEILF
ncbi:putative protein S-acyltransferase 17 [Porphyridium purpureum]|uniref:Palmitoyltransferase n=1 Tax=Porphyridium purpureum TaxID=35688 RepID=A0A5J4YZ13_PORPP|nr:putative protein S-acyltransferase 17 [Porphyridium purpureum]|eukprot:POR7738..scf208_2